MISTPQSETVPIELRDGVIRVAGTRVTLDTVINSFNRTMSAEEIAIAYPAVSLADIYDVIAYYLRHREEVDLYINAREERAVVTRQQVEARHPDMRDIRERLQTRLDTKKRD